MRDLDEMLNEVRSRVSAITRAEELKHRDAMEQYALAREMYEKARGYKRTQTYLEEDNFRSSMIEAYATLIRALEQCAGEHIERGDSLVQQLARASKSVTIQIEN